MKVSLTRLIVLGLIIFSFLFASCSSRLLDNCAIFDVFFALGCKPYEMEVKTTVDGLEYCITRDNTIFICDKIWLFIISTNMTHTSSHRKSNVI